MTTQPDQLDHSVTDQPIDLDVIEADLNRRVPALDPEDRSHARGLLIEARRLLDLVGEQAVEIERLRGWKEQSLPVIDGLQDLGHALGVPLGHRITGPEAVEKARALTAEIERLRARLAFAEVDLANEATDALHARDLAVARLDAVRVLICAALDGAPTTPTEGLTS